MARNIRNMILWHPDMDINEIKVTFVHRGAKGNLKKIDGKSIEKLERSFMILKEGTHIPYHRIIQIEYKNKIFWNK
jgi:uncharacterized protein (UPF0248 family)